MPWQGIIDKERNLAAQTVQKYLRGYIIRNKIKKIRHELTIDSSWAEIEKGGYFRIVNYVSPADIRSKLGPYSVKEIPPDGLSAARVYKDSQMLEDGSHYEGEWASLRTTAGTQGYDRVREGFGVQRFMDGSIYEGWFKGDRAHGKGRLIHTDGYIYEGDWFEDKAQGRGIYTNQDGSKYEGQFYEDRQEGKGTEVWADGAQYTGEYKNGKKNGRGLFKWTDGSQYDGEFVDNNFEGQGEYRWADGRVYKGTWVNN